MGIVPVRSIFAVDTTGVSLPSTVPGCLILADNFYSPLKTPILSLAPSAPLQPSPDPHRLSVSVSCKGHCSLHPDQGQGLSRDQHHRNRKIGPYFSNVPTCQGAVDPLTGHTGLHIISCLVYSRLKLTVTLLPQPLECWALGQMWKLMG